MLIMNPTYIVYWESTDVMFDLKKCMRLLYGILNHIMQNASVHTTSTSATSKIDILFLHNFSLISNYGSSLEIFQTSMHYDSCNINLQ